MAEYFWTMLPILFGYAIVLTGLGWIGDIYLERRDSKRLAARVPFDMEKPSIPVTEDFETFERNPLMWRMIHDTEAYWREAHSNAQLQVDKMVHQIRYRK